MPSARNLLALVALLAWFPSAHAQTATGRYRYQQKPTAPRVAYVYICESRRAYAYHSYQCHGLNRCRSGVSRVTAARARDYGYVPCKICY